MNKNELIELFENAEFPSVCDTHTGKVFHLWRVIVMVLPNGEETQGMMYGNYSGVFCRSLDDFSDFEVA